MTAAATLSAALIGFAGGWWLRDQFAKEDQKTIIVTADDSPEPDSPPLKHSLEVTADTSGFDRALDEVWPRRRHR